MKGKITRVLQDGYFFVSSGDHGYVGNFGAFSGYKGESAREFGIKVGREIEFEASGDKIVSATLL